MNIKPVNDHILVELNKTDSSIIIADDGQSITRGTVIATPDDIPFISTTGWVKEDGTGKFQWLLNKYHKGQIVYFRKYADQDCLIKKDNKDYALIRLTDVMGVEDGESS